MKSKYLPLKLIFGIVLCVFASNAFAEADHDSAAEEAATMTVYKTPTCGCCQKWVDHINDNQLSSKVVEMGSLVSIKNKFQIQGRYQSCHTGVVKTAAGEYVFEGHVPAEHVKAFLSNPPEDAIGLSVPGMPIGSPGMEVGERKDYYQVLLLKNDGSSSVFAHVNQDS